MSGREIERKFLVMELPDLEGLRGDEIRQGYLALDNGVEVQSACGGTRPH
ncbi:MAG: hypothetical protein ACYC91_11345 [Solirubrobacteraceae bacterium]